MVFSTLRTEKTNATQVTRVPGTTRRNAKSVSREGCEIAIILFARRHPPNRCTTVRLRVVRVQTRHRGYNATQYHGCGVQPDRGDPGPMRSRAHTPLCARYENERVVALYIRGTRPLLIARGLWVCTRTYWSTDGIFCFCFVFCTLFIQFFCTPNK